MRRARQSDSLSKDLDKSRISSGPWIAQPKGSATKCPRNKHVAPHQKEKAGGKKSKWASHPGEALHQPSEHVEEEGNVPAESASSSRPGPSAPATGPAEPISAAGVPATGGSALYAPRASSTKQPSQPGSSETEEHYQHSEDQEWRDSPELDSCAPHTITRWPSSHLLLKEISAAVSVHVRTGPLPVPPANPIIILFFLLHIFCVIPYCRLFVEMEGPSEHLSGGTIDQGFTCVCRNEHGCYIKPYEWMRCESASGFSEIASRLVTADK
ncbi:uncharacterized protein LOC128351245 [Hemicordylus capensis]|uniref:uncharacterized protein LOC128351245 n=1 Tax=Hemicordylus capensis TaxID=884348 RepID=UPI0023040EA4|nr:uncharacterized protein LOC128351245 [Hemicordylus capensis]